MDVVVLEAADDLDDGVDFADVGEEFVAEPLPGAGALDEAGDVDELEDGGDNFLRLGDGAEFFQALIGDGDDAVVGVDGAEGIVGRLRLAGARDRVEERAFPDIGQTDDSGA